jgi:hypothetical protein
MKLQELVNKLSNLLASGAGEAEVKVEDAHIQTITLNEVSGVKTIVIAGIK